MITPRLHGTNDEPLPAGGHHGENIARDLGLQPEDVMSRIFGGIETNSAAATHPKAKGFGRTGRDHEASLERLYDFQHADGGWGWWKDGEMIIG